MSNQFGISETLFSTLVAINAAGYDAGLNSPVNDHYRVRKQIREELAKRNIPCLPELKAFYESHKKLNETADLSQYISFALLAGKAPVFELPAGPIPPDVEQLRAFSSLLARFYQEAGLQELWARSRPAYLQAVREYQDKVISILFEANGYVRNPSGYMGRRFEVFLDLMGSPNQIQVRNYRDNYFVVITPTTEPVFDEIRDAYLAYLLDPLSIKFSIAIASKDRLKKYAQDAPTLPALYKSDFSLLVTKSLIKAIDSRLMHVSPEQKQIFISDAMRQGFILTEAFSELLPAYERQPESLRDYYPDLIEGLDVKKEQKRLKDIDFAKVAPERPAANPSALQLPEAETTLQSAEGLYERDQYEDAIKAFKKVFEQTSDKSLQGRAYYGLARIAVRQNRKDEAVELFQRTADDDPNPAITAWAHVYLGRLALAAGDQDRAKNQFKLAQAQQGASQLALDAADKGLKQVSGEQEQ